MSLSIISSTFIISVLLLRQLHHQFHFKRETLTFEGIEWIKPCHEEALKEIFFAFDPVIRENHKLLLVNLLTNSYLMFKMFQSSGTIEMLHQQIYPVMSVVFSHLNPTETDQLCHEITTKLLADPNQDTKSLGVYLQIVRTLIEVPHLQGLDFGANNKIFSLPIPVYETVLSTYEAGMKKKALLQLLGAHVVLQPDMESGFHALADIVALS